VPPNAKSFGGFLESRMREAEQQGDSRRADYYRELLRRGELER
jgi:hypothetical protein